MQLMEGFFSRLFCHDSPRQGWYLSRRNHQQASFHLSMRQTVMSEAPSRHPPLCPLYTCCFSILHPTPLINTHTPPLVPLPMCDPSNLADCTPWAYSAESNASLFLFGSHSSAPVRSHSHLTCALEMGLSGIPSLPFPPTG